MIDVRSVLLADLAKAISVLGGSPGDEAIHEARRAIKRSRTALRLLRDAVGEGAYRESNRALRDAARCFAEARESRALLDTAQRYEVRAAVAALRKRHARSSVAARKTARAVDALQATAEDVRRWRLPRDARPAARKGLERIYRQARKALARCAPPTTARLHELRKQVKHLGQALVVLEEKRRPRRLERLAERLGEEHDLALLEAYGATRASRSRRARLEHKALAKASRLLRRRPKSFMRKIKSLY